MQLAIKVGLFFFFNITLMTAIFQEIWRSCFSCVICLCMQVSISNVRSIQCWPLKMGLGGLCYFCYQVNPTLIKPLQKKTDLYKQFACFPINCCSLIHYCFTPVKCTIFFSSIKNMFTLNISQTSRLVFLTVQLYTGSDPNYSTHYNSALNDCIMIHPED